MDVRDLVRSEVRGAGGCGRDGVVKLELVSGVVRVYNVLGK